MVILHYNDPDVAFPRDCGKTRKTDSRWFSLPGGRFNARDSLPARPSRSIPVSIAQFLLLPRLSLEAVDSVR